MPKFPPSYKNTIHIRLNICPTPVRAHLIRSEESLPNMVTFGNTMSQDFSISFGEMQLNPKKQYNNSLVARQNQAELPFLSNFFNI
jgi:hypothetical protein